MPTGKILHIKSVDCLSNTRGEQMTNSLDSGHLLSNGMHMLWLSKGNNKTMILSNISGLITDWINLSQAALKSFYRTQD
jgi:hypothetical protein